MNTTETQTRPQPQGQAWADLRRLGWPVRKIAQVEHVSMAQVTAQTRPYGPFKVAPSRPGAAAQYRAWAQQRRQGATIAQVAAAAGVSQQWVGRVTAQLGPFPRQRAQVDETTRATWVRLRREGWSAEAIATAEGGVSAAMIQRTTQDAGPFRARSTTRQRWSRAEIARYCRVQRQLVDLWARTGALPEPLENELSARGQIWRAQDVRAWAAQHLHRCPVCGARVRSVPRHAGVRHPGSNPASATKTTTRASKTSRGQGRTS